MLRQIKVWAAVVRAAITALVIFCCISESELWWWCVCPFIQLLTGCKVIICCRLKSDTLVENVFYNFFSRVPIDIKTYKNAEAFTAFGIQIKIQLLL